MMLIFLSTLRMSTPLLFAAIGGMFCERSGVINIALEGFMLFGAFFAAAFTIATGNPWLGLAGALAGGAAFGLLYGLFVIQWRINQVVAGTAFNFLAMGLIPFALKILYGSTGASPSIPIEQRFQIFPVFGAWGITAFAWFVLRYTPYGLWLSFAGENPEALDAAGISVRGVRYSAVMIGSALAAAGGASLSIFLSSGYARNMSAGRGFMALAALIFGKWRPIPAALACLFFAFMEALQISAQNITELPIPAEFIQCLPYLATMIALAGFVGSSKPPKQLGNAFPR